MSIEYIEMVLIVNGLEHTVWQKTEPTEVQIVLQQHTSYVDADGNPIQLPDVYEMRATTGEVLKAPKRK